MTLDSASNAKLCGFLFSNHYDHRSVSWYRDFAAIQSTRILGIVEALEITLESQLTSVVRVYKRPPFLRPPAGRRSSAHRSSLGPRDYRSVNSINSKVIGWPNFSRAIPLPRQLSEGIGTVWCMRECPPACQNLQGPVKLCGRKSTIKTGFFRV